MNPVSSNMPAMNKRQRKAEVIQCLIEHCQRPAQMPLGFLPLDKDVYACPADPDAVARVLSERFSTEDLVESGVFTVEEREVASLASTLIGAGSFIVLRDARSGTPYELLTRAGCLSGGALPLFEILHDGCTQRLLKSGTGDLVVAFDLETVIMLRACGLPATLAVGLEAMPLEDVGRFCQSFGLECSGIDQEEEWRDENGNQSEDHPGDRIRQTIFRSLGDFAPDRWGRTLMRYGERRRAEKEAGECQAVAEVVTWPLGDREYLLGAGSGAR